MLYKLFIGSEGIVTYFFIIATVSCTYSEEMKKILLSLPNEYLEFITLRYQECYEEEELCAYYNCGIDEIREKEKNILSYLKEQTYIQKRYSKRKKI